MKKYLTLAALLGAIAFASVSFLAQAEENVAPAAEQAMEAAAPAVDAAVAPAVSVEEDCKASASVAKADGTMPSAEEVDAAVKACVEAHAAPVATDVTAAPAEEGHAEE